MCVFVCLCAHRCTYHYDAFGNLNQKNCSSGSYQYIVDPFGLFGGDVIAEVSKHYASRHGLVHHL